MMEALLSGLLGNRGACEDGKKEIGLGSLLVIGIILFVLLGGLKQLKPKTDEDEACCE